MLALLRAFLCWLGRLILSLRYRVRVKGTERLRGLPRPFRLDEPRPPAAVCDHRPVTLLRAAAWPYAAWTLP